MLLCPPQGSVSEELSATRGDLRTPLCPPDKRQPESKPGQFPGGRERVSPGDVWEVDLAGFGKCMREWIEGVEGDPGLSSLGTLNQFSCIHAPFFVNGYLLGS